MKKEAVYRIFSNMPTLRTERLSLRQMHPIDTEDMYAYACRPEVTEYLLWSPHPTVQYTEEYLRYISKRYSCGDFFDWAIIEKESRRMIGTCGFTRIDTQNNTGEIGYVLNPDFCGRGLCTEAVRAVVEFGFSSLGLHRIEARFMRGNEPSFRLMKRIGMEFEGYHTDAVYAKGSYRTVGICALTAENYTVGLRSRQLNIKNNSKIS